MTFYIAPIVEGHTEVGCLESLLQRIWGTLLAAPIRLQVLQPSRCQRDAFINPNHPQFSTKIEEAYAKLMQRLRRDTANRGLLLLLLDAEVDCPATLGPRLLEAAKIVQGNVDISCVLAKRVVENWIVAGCSTLAGINGLPAMITPPTDAEGCHGVRWLKEQLKSGSSSQTSKKTYKKTYKKTVDAVPFIAAMDLEGCRANSRSFRKLCKELELRLPPPLSSDPPPEAGQVSD